MDVMPDIQLIYGDNFTFQQDGAPAHTAKKTINFFSDKKIKILPWPSKSPDLNIIENVWHMLSCQIYNGKKYENLNTLWMELQKCADSLDPAKITSLYDGMPSRCTKLIQNGGNIITK